MKVGSDASTEHSADKSLPRHVPGYIVCDVRLTSRDMPPLIFQL